jgi:hypothetical protein
MQLQILDCRLQIEIAITGLLDFAVAEGDLHAMPRPSSETSLPNPLIARAFLDSQ